MPAPMAVAPNLTALAVTTSAKDAGVLDKAAATARDFEAMFVNAMLQQVFAGVGEGPFSGGYAAGVWRSFLTDEYAKTIVKAGGFGIADHVQRFLLAQQEANGASQPSHTGPAS
ncbi:MAG TPA: rod-binding protein [Xanthobacteraceae bacterium]|nr:rod-binding protein [Xanthobacteraceae bacterium]